MMYDIRFQKTAKSKKHLWRIYYDAKLLGFSYILK